MNLNTSFNEIKISKAKESDWDNILSLLKDTKLDHYLNDISSYETYYVFKLENELISCFSLCQYKNFGFIELFAVNPKYQRLRVGLQMANEIPHFAKKLNMSKLFLSSWEAIGFWQKTQFKEIKFYEITDVFYLWCYYQIIDTDKKNAHKRKFFILSINDNKEQTNK